MAIRVKDHAWVFAIAALVRFACFALIPDLPALLASRVEISTPVTSFKRLQEGVHLFQRGISPYDGGVFHQSPILLAIFSTIPSYETFPIITQSLYVAADLLGAEALLRIAQSGQSTSSRLYTSIRKDSRASDTAIAATYLFSPLTIASCLARPTSVFTNTAVLQTIAFAASGDFIGTLYSFALTAYLSGYLILLAPPIALLFSTYGMQLSLTDLTPNIGLWWYFFIEMFDSFRTFFLGVFWLHMASYVGALTIRIPKQPLFVIISLLGIFAVFQPYPSIVDTGLYFAVLPLYRHVLPLLRYGFIAAAALLYAAFLGPAFWHLWIYAGSGNANFFYAITLVWSLGLSIIIADSIYAVIRDELDVERPELRGKDVRQI
ncbi:MAG: hypothetical protein Q9159_001848 [Coniocarpon cinnabarinum]